MAPAATRHQSSRWWQLAVILLLAWLVSLGLWAGNNTQDVHAASTFNNSAYNAATKKGQWLLQGGNGQEYAKIYIDSNNTLHMSAANAASALDASGTPLNGNISLADLKSVTAVSIEGKNYFNDNSAGFVQKFANLTKITGLDNVDTSQLTSLAYFFSYQSNSVVGSTNTNAKLTDIEGLGSWDVSHVTTMDHVFAGQKNLLSVPGIDKWNVANVTNFNSAFYDDNALAALPDLSGWNTAKGQDFHYMFANMYQLTNLASIQNWPTQLATNMSYMFENDSQLKFNGRLNWNVGQVTDFSGMFHNDTAVQSLDLSKWNVAQATLMPSMFQGMTNLTSLDITGWQPTAVTNTGNMFQDDAKLTDLPGIANWTLTNITNLTSMFQGMTSIKNLPVAKWQLSTNGNANITQIFYQDYALTTLDLSSWRVKGAWSAGDKVFPTYTYTNSAAQSQLKSIKFGSGWTGKVVLPTFQLSATEYGTWRGEQHDKQYVSGAGTVKETYQPPTDASARTDTFRFAYDVIAKLEDNQGNPIQLAGVPIIVQDSNGKEVMRGTTGADGTVTVPINATDGDYTVKLGDLPGGYEAVTDTRTATINGDDVTVTLVVDKQNDSNLIKQYPHAGGHGTFLTVVAGALAVVLGTTGMLARRRA